MTTLQWKKCCLNFLFYAGAFLMIWEINIYRNTVIDWKIPTGIFFLTGIAATFINHTMLEQPGGRSVFIKLVYNTVVFGGIGHCKKIKKMRPPISSFRIIFSPVAGYNLSSLYLHRSVLQKKVCKDDRVLPHGCHRHPW